MTPSAPRIDLRLVSALERLDDGVAPAAELWRRLGSVADALGVARPSYEQTRVVLRRHRRGRLAPTAGAVLLDVTVRARPPEALLDLLEGAK